jgi:nicotinamidase-related amidase
LKKVLVVVDMQNDFISGALGGKDAQSILPEVVKIINEKSAAGYEVIFTQDTHGKDYLSTPEGKALPVTHCVKGTRGWQLEGSVAALSENCKIFQKPTFGSVELFDYLKKINPSVVEFVGVCTDICVVSNALGIKAFLPCAEIIVHANACAGTSKENHNAALTTMRSCQIKIVE